MAAFENVSQHAVIQSRHRPRIFAFDGRKNALDIAVGAQTDAGQAAIGRQQKDRDIRHARLDDAVDIPDGAAPIVYRGQAAIAGNLHQLTLEATATSVPRCE